MNKLVNLWFQEEQNQLKVDKGIDISNVKPLIVIDIETLLFNEDAFNKHKIDFESCLIEYCKNYINYSSVGRRFNNEEEAIQAQKNSYVPFSFFLDNKVDKLVELGFGLNE